MAQLKKKNIGNGAIGAGQVLLENGEWLRARDSEDTGNVNVLSVQGQDLVLSNPPNGLVKLQGTDADYSDTENPINAGAIQIIAGHSDDSDSSGGNVYIAAGNTIGDGEQSGNLFLSSGRHLGSNGDSGSTTIQTGEGSQNSGAIQIRTGNASSGSAGGITLQVGDSGATENLPAVSIVGGDLQIRGLSENALTFHSASTSNVYTGFRINPAASGQVVYQLPPTDGEGGHVLSTDGEGVLSWTEAGGGGGGDLTGEANRIPYFDGNADLVTDSTNFYFHQSNENNIAGLSWSAIDTDGSGYAGTVTAEQGGLAFGTSYTESTSDTPGLISASGNGIAYGSTSSDGGSIQSVGDGAYSAGQVDAGATITATGIGSFAVGESGGVNSIITAPNTGSFAGAYNYGDDSVVSANGLTSFSQGSIQSGSFESLLRSNTSGSMARGSINGSNGIIEAAGIGSLVQGEVSGSDKTLRTEGSGSIAAGRLVGSPGGGAITVPANGALAIGEVSGSSTLAANGSGHLVFGAVLTGSGDITSTLSISGRGSLGGGCVYKNGTFASNGDANVTVGNVKNGSSLGVEGNGNVWVGTAEAVVDGNSSSLTIHGDGNAVFGKYVGSTINLPATSGNFVYGAHTNNLLLITDPTSNGNFIGGHGTGGSFVATGSGGMAFGFVDLGGDITVGNGAFAGGYVNGESIVASVEGAFAFGRGPIAATAVGAFATGRTVSATGACTMAHGENVSVSSSHAVVFGKDLDLIGDTDIWIGTEPLFALGIGAAEFALMVDKDGRIHHKGAESSLAIRTETGDATLSARTDLYLLMNASAAAVVTFPPGEKGLHFYIKDISGDASSNNITFAGDGVDLVEAGTAIDENFGTRHFVYNVETTTWYSI